MALNDLAFRIDIALVIVFILGFLATTALLTLIISSQRRSKRRPPPTFNSILVTLVASWIICIQRIYNYICLLIEVDAGAFGSVGAYFATFGLFFMGNVLLALDRMSASLYGEPPSFFVTLWILIGSGNVHQDSPIKSSTQFWLLLDTEASEQDQIWSYNDWKSDQDMSAEIRRIVLRRCILMSAGLVLFYIPFWPSLIIGTFVPDGRNMLPEWFIESARFFTSFDSLWTPWTIYYFSYRAFTT
ncbi:hypothetical protein BCR33DRAFT_717303 [Rhizoclosmatium globosum]|uniref:Family A G protein-coupled receptor-like protein n=1 Tax=Rhizoclosmatium globosum TaxID=329046 RepID=A0A1Y2C9K0_9FUNG|nr:hypothetical protein BCR33DRAFT_717303 [Rhizoclosmatium globosum]|eukprot:ORY43616.1 hypothetical protein BCR33DRAFT_717303 [Rhizoclosmatium globosum]